MIPTAAERLAREMTTLLIRIDQYCQKIASSEIRHGLCLVSPKRAHLKPPTPEIDAELHRIASAHFKTQKATGFYFYYFTPPVLPEVEGKDTQTPAVVEDYQLTYRLPEFDALAEQQTRARGIIYCPIELDVEAWEVEWFAPQQEATRLTPLVHQGIIELQIMGLIRTQLWQPWRNVFEYFIRDYVSDTESDKERGRYFCMSTFERKLYKEGKKDWAQLYTELDNLFPPNEAPLIDAYKMARKKAVQSRNDKIKDMLWDFIDYIEDTLIKQSQLPEEIKANLLKEVRNHLNKKEKQAYKAKRPTLCISDIECAQFLYRSLQKFIEDPKGNIILGELSIYIWVCQHAAFSDLDLKVEDILNLKMHDIDFEYLTINVSGYKSDMTRGLADILQAWIGTADRKNIRKLFPNLTYDNLEKTLGKLSINFFGSEWKLQPRDFLTKVHCMSGARIPIAVRKQVDEQAALLKTSPYSVKTWKIKKHISDSYKEKRLEKQL